MQPQSTGTCDYCHQQYPFARLIRQKRQNYGKLICEPCETERMAAWRRTEEFRDRMRTAGRKQYDKSKAEFHALKDKPCMDCGGSFPHYVMDFDHPDRSIKTDYIARMVRKANGKLTAEVLAEIAKCELVCSNCHRIRTRRQMERGEWQLGRPRLPGGEPWAGPSSLNKAEIDQPA